jgi:hypothetical protein
MRADGSRPWLTWVLLLAGIAVAIVSVHAASILARSGPGGLTLLYPYIEILNSPLLRIPAGFANPIAQLVLYLQFPFYGLLVGFLTRERGVWTGVAVLVSLHGVGVIVAALLVHIANPYLNFF